MKSSAFALIYSLLLALPLIGCSDDKSTSPKPTSESAPAPAAADATSPHGTTMTGDAMMDDANKNPSVIFCEKSGGQYKLVKTADGEKGECHLSNGQVEDADALYMGHMKARDSMGMGQPKPQTPENQKGSKIPNQEIGMANMAAAYCVEIGGKMKVVVENGSEVGYCHLKSGQEVKAWELFRAHHPQQ